MYSYGQFCKTPIGRMRVGKPQNWIDVCDDCEINFVCAKNEDLFDFCTHAIPPHANLKRPNVGGKDQHK